MANLESLELTISANAASAMRGVKALAESLKSLQGSIDTSMGTTLWFTKEDKDAGMPQAILACGQYTMCYNLLDYIEKIEKGQVNLTPSHDLIKACKPQLLEAWEKFQANPQWMVPKKK